MFTNSIQSKLIQNEKEFNELQSYVKERYPLTYDDNNKLKNPNSYPCIFLSQHDGEYDDLNYSYIYLNVGRYNLYNKVGWDFKDNELTFTF